MDPEIIPVRWEVAHDERFASLAASGTAYAEPAWAHSVHVDVQGLEPSRWYWYRFIAGDATSAVGHTRTAPAKNAELDRLRFAFASCQHYEQGYFGAYAHMVRDEPDLILFLGDYIYDSSWGTNHVRKHNTPATHSLEDYRIRHALYKSDPDLRAAHAAAPWVVTWDDHEVQNDYANDRSENADDPAWFLQRRAAAYKAYYEHHALPRSALPFGPHMRMYNRVGFGNLANFHVLDDRQYRSPQACQSPGYGGSDFVVAAQCKELSDPNREMLGHTQSAWLHDGLGASRSKWNIVVQQTLMAQFDNRQFSGKPRPGRTVWTDGWDGYPMARRKLLDFIDERKVANPVVIGGDVHMFMVADLKRDFDDPTSPVVASEFVGTSITAQPISQEAVKRMLPDNPHVKFANGEYRGYVRVNLTPGRMVCDLRAMATVQQREAACSTLASFAVEAGRPGAQRA